MAKIKLSGKRRAVNIIVVILSLCCFVIGGLCVFADSIMGNIRYEKADTDDVSKIIDSGDKDFDFGNISADNLYHDPKIMNIMLLSLDNYQQGDNGRTDSMMMVSIDNRNQKLKLTSFMRDMYVSIPGYGFNKLNAAYAFGGPSLTMATIENNFRVDVDRYVIIDYKKFVEIIDTIGGIDLEITADEAQIINEESKEDQKLALSAGKVHMTGKQARMYARIRKIDDDFERTNRQRKVVTAVVEKMKKTDLVTLTGYLSKILTMITTDMSKDEVLGLISNIMTYLGYEVESYRLPIDGHYFDATVDIGGLPAMILVPYLQENIDEFVKFIYGEDNIPTLKKSYTLDQYQASYDQYGSATKFLTGEANTPGTADTGYTDETMGENDNDGTITDGDAYGYDATEEAYYDTGY
ncbi:MAG: LCP family protein [Oscillospiraceae bacterium]|nr:LCP family protein [Oscillospiraceae bacterium]